LSPRPSRKGVRACHVTRRHGLTPQQLFASRREAHRKADARIYAPFVPAIVEAAPTHVIELDLDGVSVWIWREADAAMVAAIIGALKASR
jgi:transposase